MNSTIVLTTAEAKQIVADRFILVSSVSTGRSRCYESWTETWRRKDGAAVTAEDVRAFVLLPRGQGHYVRAAWSDIIIDCTCDSGD